MADQNSDTAPLTTTTTTVNPNRRPFKPSTGFQMYTQGNLIAAMLSFMGYTYFNHYDHILTVMFIFALGSHFTCGMIGELWWAKMRFGLPVYFWGPFNKVRIMGLILNAIVDGVILFYFVFTRLMDS